MNPSAMAMSACSISPEKTLTMRASRRTRSAGDSPRATERRAGTSDGYDSVMHSLRHPDTPHPVTSFRRPRRRLDDRLALFRAHLAHDLRHVVDVHAAAEVDDVAANHAAVDDLCAAVD